MDINCKKWPRLATLGYLAWLTASYTAMAGDLPALPATSQNAGTRFPEQISRLPMQNMLWAAGVIAFAVMAAMVPVVPLRRATEPTNRQNGGNGHNGHSEEDEQTGQARHHIQQPDGENGSESFFREVFEAANDLIYTLDLQGRFTSMNPAALRALGYTAEEVRGLTTDKVVAPECLELTRHMREAKLATGKSTTYELTFIVKDGGRILLEVSTRLITRDGQPYGIVGIGRDITERKRAEIATAEGSELLDVLLENSKDLIYFKDSASRFVRYSTDLARHFGVEDTDALKGRSDFDFFTREHAQAAYEDEQEVIRTGTPIVRKLEVETHKDGRLTWARTTKTPWRDKTGKIIGIVGISSDVTALKEVEDKLAAEQELLRTLLDTVPECIYFKDNQSRFVRVSKSKAQKTLKHVPEINTRRSRSNGSEEKSTPSSDTERLVGLTDFDMFAEEHARRAFQDEQEIIRSGKPVIGKVEKETHRDGSVSWSLTTKMPWRDKDGNVVGTLGISKDITALKQAEEKIAYERELFQSLLNTLPDNIYFKDRESRFVRVSASKVKRSLQPARSLHLAKLPPGTSTELPAHLASEEEFAKYLIGKTDFDTFDEEFARQAFEEEQEIIRTGNPVIGKLECILGADGTTSWMFVTKMPWRDKDGNIIGTLGVSRDVTALKQAETELEATHRHLVQASRMAGMAEVATDVLHNVGNVLNSVNVSCSLVIDRVQETSFANLARIPQLMRENAGRLDEFLTTDERGRHLPEYLASLAQTFEDQKSFLLHELSQLRSHIDHIKQVVNMQQNYAKVAGVEESVEVHQLADDALRMNADALTRHTVAYRREYEPMPPIFVDKHKVLQILVNLIRNAKYAVSDSPRRDKQMTLCIRRKGEDRVQFEVADNGVGIAPENLTRIFAHGFTTRKGGHGFGLHSGALSARDLGGSLTAHSDGLGTGATFTLELPFKNGKAAS